MVVEYKVVKLWGEPDEDEKELNQLGHEWEIIAIVPMLGKIDPKADIADTEYFTWPVAYFAKRPSQTRYQV